VDTCGHLWTHLSGPILKGALGMTTAAGNVELLDNYQRLGEELGNSRSRFITGDVWHAQHGDFLENS